MATKKDVLVKLDEKVEVIGTGKYGLTINRSTLFIQSWQRNLLLKGLQGTLKNQKQNNLSLYPIGRL